MVAQMTLIFHNSIKKCEILEDTINAITTKNITNTPNTHAHSEAKLKF